MDEVLHEASVWRFSDGATERFSSRIQILKDEKDDYAVYIIPSSDDLYPEEKDFTVAKNVSPSTFAVLDSYWKGIQAVYAYEVICDLQTVGGGRIRIFVDQGGHNHYVLSLRFSDGNYYRPPRRGEDPCVVFRKGENHYEFVSNLWEALEEDNLYHPKTFFYRAASAK